MTGCPGLARSGGSTGLDDAGRDRRRRDATTSCASTGPAAAPSDLATIIYTSGTTGRPKGCELTHRNLLAAVRNAVHGALPEIFETPGGSTLLFLPLAHVVRPDHRGRLPGVRRRARALAGHRHGGRGPARVPAHVPARRAAGVREGLQHRAAAGLREPGQEQDLRRRSRPRPSRTARRSRVGQARRRAAAPARAVRPARLRQAARGRRRQGHATPSPAARRWASGSATSSAASASPCSRATG